MHPVYPIRWDPKLLWLSQVLRKNAQDALHRLNRLHTNFEARKYAISLDDRGLLIEQMLNWCREIGYQVRLVWPLFLN